MALHCRILGQPFADNALFLKVDTGQKQFRLLFDCGENTIDNLSLSEIQKIDHLFFSHFHLDHVAGFDHFIRANYDRANKPVHIWGPENTAKLIFHRLNSFTWNLTQGIESKWLIHEIRPQKILTFQLSAKNGFSRKRKIRESAFSQTVFSNEAFKVSVRFLEHKIPVLGFKTEEAPKLKINEFLLNADNLKQGEWLGLLKDPSLKDSDEIEVLGIKRNLGELRQKLLFRQPGKSAAYLTDFYLTQDAASLTEWLHGCDCLFCESQYLEQERILAEKNCHLTAKSAAGLAKKSGVKKLILFHFSKRYVSAGALPFLNEAKSVFEQSFLPEGWL